METQKNTAENAVKPAKKIRRHIKVIPRKRKRIGASNTAYNIKMANEKNRGNRKEIEKIINFYSAETEESEIEGEVTDENKKLSDNLDGIYSPSLGVAARRAETLIGKDDEENLDFKADGIYGEKGVLVEEVFGGYGFSITANLGFGYEKECLSDDTFKKTTGKKIVRPRLTF